VSNDSRARLRELLAKKDMIVAPFVFDCLQARLAEQAGFEAIYMTGFGTSAARGFPDLGLLTMTEMVANVRAIANAVKIPVICDADTGYGNPMNVWRTVREYEDAGAAALHIEDQVFPKRCGFLAGKQVIAMDEMIPKVRAACDARRDRNLVIIARSDALAVNGWEDVIRRCRAYREAGADMIFVDGIRTRDDLARYAKELTNIPALYNGTMLPVPELAKLGFEVTIYPATLMVAFESMRTALRELKSTGEVKGGRLGGGMFDDFVKLMGAPEMDALGKKYND
jgi:2-methylisocitrate lyase-like PEP mutase family enzyme